MILVVEDDLDLADTCAMLLEAHGYRVMIAANGADALNIVTRCMPRLVVSDCLMPRMDGRELCTRIRAMPVGTTVPIILMSASDDHQNLNTSIYNAFLKKPFLAEQLIATVQTLLNPVNTHAARWGRGSSSLH